MTVKAISEIAGERGSLLRIPIRLDALAGRRGLQMPRDDFLKIATGVIRQAQVILYPRPNPSR